MNDKSDDTSNNTLIIANCSGFLGDRFSAAKEMVTGGRIDVLTGDYLAELTMALLFSMKMKSPDKGYAAPFLKQMEEVMGLCLDRGIKVVANAGGLNPLGLSEELKKIGQALGLNPSVATITGDDLLATLSALQAKGEAFTHLDTGMDLKAAQGKPITANAYLGGWGITRALNMGADIVVTGRVADASLVSGPCAWKFKWKENDWDRLAGAYAAGHIIECGTQATGGNYSFIDEVPSYTNMGFPVAEMHEDGSFVITKHPGTGGLVSKGTVTAQLVYEIRTPAYLTPDVTVRFDTLEMVEEGKDRVRVFNTRGEPPTKKTKVCINTLWGHRNTMTVVLTGLDIEKKAAIVEKTLFELLGGKEQFAEVETQLIRSDRENPATNDLAFAHLRISVMDPDSNRAGKFFSSKIVEMALASIPGFTLTGPPSKASLAIRHWPSLISNELILQQVHLNDEVVDIEPGTWGKEQALVGPDVQAKVVNQESIPSNQAAVPTKKIPLGHLFATRSGDKGGNANLGVWARDSVGFSFLSEFLTVDRLKSLLPELLPLGVERYELPNILALNFYIKGLLGHGVAASMRSDPQAKTLGEYFRAKIIEVPVSVLESDQKV
ncbi:MAG: acyclic terpene utilization AtuA family protein [Desulfobacterium sp.]|nr:acyclic terpene utilization AtuA family protein [Desulfobacterium sp.]